MRSGRHFPVGIFIFGIILLVASIGGTIYASHGGEAVAFLIPIAFVSLALFGFIFWLWMLIDCAIKESDQGNTKIVWVLIILFANLFGALAYFLIRRPQRLA